MWSTPERFSDREMISAGIRVPGPQASCTPTVVARPGRGHVVPLAAELVVGHDHQGVAGLRSGRDRLEQVDQVVAAVGLAGVAGVLVLRAVRLDEADRRQGAGLGGGEEVGLVLQVGAAGLAGGVVGEVVERLVVVLEQRAGVAGRRVVPAAGVPVPGDAGRRRAGRRCWGTSGRRSAGRRAAAGECGTCCGWIVLTAKSPQATASSSTVGSAHAGSAGRRVTVAGRRVLRVAC